MFTKSQVGFEHPAKGADHCSECKHYRAASESCAIVSGVVMPEDWCRKYMPVTKGPLGVHQEMSKYKAGTLHSGSSRGPVVTNRKQAIAIALSESGMSNKSKKRGRFKI